MKVFEFKISADYLPYILKGDTDLFEWAGGAELLYRGNKIMIKPLNSN